MDMIEIPDYEKVDKVYNDLDNSEPRTSKEKIEIAQALCEKNNILFSDLVLYEKSLENKD